MKLTRSKSGYTLAVDATELSGIRFLIVQELTHIKMKVEDKGLSPDKNVAANTLAKIDFYESWLKELNKTL